MSMHAHIIHYTMAWLLICYIVRIQTFQSIERVSGWVSIMSRAHLVMLLYLTIENKIRYYNTWHTECRLKRTHIILSGYRLCAGAKVALFFTVVYQNNDTVIMQPIQQMWLFFLFHFILFRLISSLPFRFEQQQRVDDEWREKNRRQNANILKIDAVVVV